MCVRERVCGEKKRRGVGGALYSCKTTKDLEVSTDGMNSPEKKYADLLNILLGI